jgi:hypothetical protein
MTKCLFKCIFEEHNGIEVITMASPLKERFNKKPRLKDGVVLENILFYFDKVFSDICYTYDGLVSTVYPGILCMPGFFMHCS